MDKISEIVSASIQRDLAEVNRISTNTQNVTSTGFKALLQADTTQVDKRVHTGQLLDLSQGELRQTERSLDLAIQGQGWFLVKKGNAMLLTRNGQFKLDSTGFITNGKGYRLQGNIGDIRVDNARFAVNRDGEITQGEKAVASLVLVDTKQVLPEQYHRGEIVLDGRKGLVVNQNSTVHQGYLEQSNVEPSREVVAMMAASRHIQTMQKSLAAYDQVLKKAISELGK